MELANRLGPGPAKPRCTCTKILRLDAAPSQPVSVFGGSTLIRPRKASTTSVHHGEGGTLRTWGNNERAVGDLHIVPGSVPADVGRADDFCI